MSGDGLRDEIAAALVTERLGLEWDDLEEDEHDDYRSRADAVLPVVQAHIDAAREQVAEQIAQAIEADLDAGNWPKILGTGVRDGLARAVRIARQHTKGDGDE